MNNENYTVNLDPGTNTIKLDRVTKKFGESLRL